MATASAADIAKELYNKLTGYTSSTSAATAKSDIDTILNHYSANNASAKNAIKPELQKLVVNAASAAATGATGACYYQLGGKTYCNNGWTQAMCASYGGYFTSGQACMAMVYQALRAE